MTRTRNARGGLARRALLVTASVAAVMPLAGNAETVVAVDASVGGLAASNPYFLEGGDTESGAVSASLRPYISVREGPTTAILDGTLNLEHFFDHYGTDESAQVGASIQHHASERTTLTAGASYSTSESAARHFYNGADLTNLQPGEFPDTGVIDPTLGNISGRTSRLDVNFGLHQLLTSRSTLDLTAGAGLTRVDSTNGSDYRDTRAGASYTHQIDERTSWVASLDVGYADYFNRRVGDGLFSTALIGVDHKFTESMYGSLKAGISYSSIEVLPSGKQHVTNWAASADLCDMLASGTVCVTGSRSAEPTSLGGVTMVSTLGVSYQRAFGRDANASLGASYSKTGMSDESPVLLGRRESEVANVTASYSHRIGERISAFITPSFTSRDDEFAPKEENYQVLVGISYHFGRTP